ncbi:unnamed protein product [Blepharisma stoltei]|uniref:YTH domain-containing protein n=1 Tax=Blepharisma stoltei TaxID=1481888 RepID=A0AAU9IWK8_9CILI|nr:unnamed protein product [Blepharisma stoltei]
MDFPRDAYYLPCYVPWYSPQYHSGVWFPPYYPSYVQQQGPADTELLSVSSRAKTPLQALDVSDIPPITSQELQQLNPQDFECNLMNARFFIMKSQCEDDVHKSVKYGIWTSSYENNNKMNHVFREANGMMPIYLFFSVINSGMLVGCAEMISAVNFTARFNGWYPNFSNLGYFGVRWIFVKDLHEKRLKQIKLNYNNFDSIPDSEEISVKLGCKILKEFTKLSKYKSLLDDFSYYDMKERQVLSYL